MQSAILGREILKIWAFLLMLLSAPAAIANCNEAVFKPTALQLSKARYVEMISSCSASSYDFSKPLASGEIPFREVILRGYHEAVEIALSVGADPNITDKWGSPAFVDLINFSSEKDNRDVLSILELLGKAGVDFSRPDNHGNLALSKAAGGGEIKTIEILLLYGADPNGLNEYSRSPLFETVFGHCSPTSGKLLIEAGGHLKSMPADQIDRMFIEARKKCSETTQGRNYIKQLEAIR